MSLKIDKDYLKNKQYKKSNYLEARIAIHKYNTNSDSFYGWIWKKMNISDPVSILEIGCGTGSFWKENFSNLPEGASLLMTDFSDGMVEKAKNNLSDYNIEYKVEDIENIDFPDDSFDLIMAHHVVYHSENKDKALKELKRVVKPDGKVTITTNSEKHMLNVYEIGGRLDDNFPKDRIIDSFTEEIADKMLPQYFSDITKLVSEDLLKVTDLDVMIGYVQSAVEPRHIEIKSDFYDRYAEIVADEINEKGYFGIQKRSPLFICR